MLASEMTSESSARTDRITPTFINNLPDMMEMAPGGAHTCGIRGDGATRCWGNDSAGQLGDGTFNFAAKPVAVLLQ